MGERLSFRIPTILAILLILVSGSVFAIEINTDDAVKSMDRRIDDDYLHLGESLGFSGSSDSLIFFGKSLAMSGENRGNLIAAGETITVSGRVADDGFIAGRSVSLTGQLGGTTFTAGESVNLLAGASVDGALFVGAGTATIAGDVDGDLYAGARTLVIAGTINGDVHTGAGEIELTEGAVITGDFTYDSDTELSAAERSRIRGTVSMVDFDPDKKGDKDFDFGPVGWIFRIVLLLSILVFALLFYLFPGFKGQDTERDNGRFWTTVGWGLIPFFLYPVAIVGVLLAGIAFGITVPIGLTLLASIGLLGYVLYAFALPQIGAYLSRALGWALHEREDGALHVKTLLGFAPVFVLGLIPFVNGLAFIIASALGWGVAIEKLFGLRFKENAE